MQTKQVIIVRKDLKMRKGKMIAQGSHASLGAVFSQSYIDEELSEHTELSHRMKIVPLTPEIEDWFNFRFTKICVGCDSKEELLSLAEKAKEAGLLHFVCKDAGLTEFKGVETYTALAIGPGLSEEIDKITSHLKLL